MNIGHREPFFACQKRRCVQLQPASHRANPFFAFVIAALGNAIGIGGGEARAEVSTGKEDENLKLLIDAHEECIHAAIVAALDASARARTGTCDTLSTDGPLSLDDLVPTIEDVASVFMVLDADELERLFMKLS